MITDTHECLEVVCKVMSPITESAVSLLLKSVCMATMVDTICSACIIFKIYDINEPCAVSLQKTLIVPQH